ncbi:MAG: hypothetical protein ACE5HR_00210 [bacterium]
MKNTEKPTSDVIVYTKLSRTIWFAENHYYWLEEEAMRRRHKGDRQASISGLVREAIELLMNKTKNQSD